MGEPADGDNQPKPPAAGVVDLHRPAGTGTGRELPGGYLDPDEDPAVCAAREVEEETGWRPCTMEPLLTIQPMVSTIDQDNRLYLARGADPTGTSPDINEAEAVAWIPLDEVRDRIGNGEIVGAGSVVALLAVLLARAEGRL